MFLDQFQSKPFFDPVRSKSDVISLWMYAIKAFLVNQPVAPSSAMAKLSLVVSSMSRIFCKLGDGRKIFSLSFPFSILKNDAGEYAFITKERINVDNKMSSLILALVHSDRIFGANDIYQFLEPIDDLGDERQRIWVLLRELMLEEDAYVRYDWDKVRQNGHIHPEHHVDLAYSSYGTFKLGLHQIIDERIFADILDIESDCHYLKAP